MTTTTHPAVPLPVGAARTEEWQPNDGDRYYRNFEGENREVVAGTRYGTHVVVVFARGVQHDDATIHDGTDPVLGAPRISISTIDDAQDEIQRDTDISLTSDAARRLADVLVTAAEEADRWSAR